MKKQLSIFCVLIFISFFSFGSNPDNIDTLSTKIKNLEYTVDQIQRDKINYQIEKDLLKETYSRNYETINLLITIVLAIVGIAGFLGLRDITSIKKEYSKELDIMRSAKREFESKSKEFETEKNKFEGELKKIIETNERQNNKIRILELKEKVKGLFKEARIEDALSFVNAGLELAPDDTLLLIYQARCYTMLNHLDKAQNSYKKALLIEPESETCICNLIECYTFSNNFKEAESLIDKHKTLYENKANGGLKLVKELFELYFKGDDQGLTKLGESLIDKTDLENQKHRLPGWGLDEARYIAFYQKADALSKKLQYIILYLNGNIKGNSLQTYLG